MSSYNVSFTQTTDSVARNEVVAVATIGEAAEFIVGAVAQSARETNVVIEGFNIQRVGE